MNQNDIEIVRIKPIVLYRYEHEINEVCFTCKHFLFDWAARPFCGLGRTIYGYCIGETRSNNYYE